MYNIIYNCKPNQNLDPWNYSKWIGQNIKIIQASGYVKPTPCRGNNKGLAHYVFSLSWKTYLLSYSARIIDGNALAAYLMHWNEQASVLSKVLFGKWDPLVL